MREARPTEFVAEMSDAMSAEVPFNTGRYDFAAPLPPRHPDDRMPLLEKCALSDAAEAQIWRWRAERLEQKGQRKQREIEQDLRGRSGYAPNP